MRHKELKSRSAAILITALIALTPLGCATVSRPDTASTSEGRYGYAIRGQGSPSIVLEAGLGNGMESWSALIPQIAEITQVFAYDRAGYGGSRSKNRERDARTIVGELRLLLQAARVHPPYLLIGHSVGGTYMEFYARNFPDEVVGVILVDSRHPDFTDRCKEAGARLCDPPAFLTHLLPGAASQEFAARDATMNEVRESPPFPGVPLAVLTGMKKPLEGEAFAQVWLESQIDLAKMSPVSMHRVCQACTHYVHHDDPAAVIDAIHWVIERLPQSQPPG